jgi:hypothetical protein
MNVYNNNNSIQFFIISVLHQQPEDQLQMQHKRRQNNKYNKITTIRLSRNYMTAEKVNTQMQLVTEYINIFGIIIKLIKSIWLKGEETCKTNTSKQDTKSGNLYN